MPDYVIVDSGKLDSDLARIADVIRKKSGVTVKLDFPDAYINVLNGLLTRIPMSEGLEYVLNYDRAGYTVTGLGTCTDTDIIIPPMYEGLPVTGIRGWAFYSRFGLTSITIPDSVTSIGDGAFYGCSGLTSITIPDSVTSIGQWQFANCDSLTSVTIPCGVTSMGQAPFFNCDSLMSVTICDGATCIGTHAFFECKSLTSVIIPDSVTSIGNNAFYGCSALTSITFPRYLTSIDAYTCYQCSSLADVIIPDSVTSIGTHAFARCSSLANVTIGNSVTSIGSQAFWQCSALTSVISLSSTPPMAQAGFLANCPELEKIFVPKGCGEMYRSATNWSNYADKIEEVSIGLTYTLSSDGTTYSVAGLGTCKDTDIVIPSMYNGLPVTDIGWGAFYNRDNLTTVIIPDSVTSITNYAFSSCDNLTTVIIPDSVTSINAYAFYESSKLTSVTIGNGVTSIGELAFAGCSGLKSVTIGNSVTSIGSQAFSGCSGLTSVHINNMAAWCSIPFINGMANPLYYAHNLYMNGELVTDLVIPDGVTSIGSRTFWDCDSITSVTIPGSVKSMGDYVFVFGDSLTSVTMLANNPPTITSNTFYGISSLEKIIVPKGCGEAYKSATNWSNYASIIEEAIA